MTTLEELWAEHTYKWNTRISMASKFIAITPTSLGTFQTCPKQFDAKYISKTVEYVQGPAAKFGDYVHLALERAIRDKIPLPEDLAFLSVVVETVYQMAANIKGSISVENKDLLCLNRRGQPCKYSDWNNKYLYARADLAIIAQTLGIALDWKSGATFRKDTLQCDLMSLIMLLRYPEIEEVRSALAYTHLNKPFILQPFKRTDIQRIADLLAQLDDYNQNQLAGNYPARKSGLCREYCDVMNCKFNGKNQ